MSIAESLPRIPLTGVHHRDERVFAPLPAILPLSRRRREVQRFRKGDGTLGRRAWNPSTKDELHPFPQVALNHTNACYNGVDVVDTHFPETVRGSAFLRLAEAAQPNVWVQNRTRACASTKRHTYRCEALEKEEAPLSYLARIIREDSAPEKQQQREGWYASTALDGFRGNHFIAPAAEDLSYMESHRKLNETLIVESGNGGYMTPYQRVKTINNALRTERKLRETAAAESLVDFYMSRPGPAVYKMSNADAWWSVDPVAVTRHMTDMAESMKANPYSTTFRRASPEGRDFSFSL